MISQHTDEQRFVLNIPFYVNGSLDDEEKKWMELYLAQHPQWQISVQHAQHHRSYSQSIRSYFTAEDRFARLLKKLGWNLALVEISQQKTIGIRSKLTRFWLSGLIGIIIGATFVAILHDLELKRGESKNCPQSENIRITLSPNIQWGSLLVLLREHKLQIVNGPNQEGEVWLHLHEGASTSQTLTLLRNNPSIEQATPIAPMQVTDGCRP